MAISSSPSMSQVAAEFGGSVPHGLNEYYGVRFSDGSYAPSSGNSISLNNFRNKSKYVPPPPPPPPPPYYGCFSQDTPIKLQSGEIIPVSDIKLGDFLVSGACVNVLLNIKNVSHGKYMKIFSEELGEYIYATGDHLINDNNNFIRVSEYYKSEMTDIIPDNFVCMITDDHKIPLGEHTFWDWADRCDPCDAKTVD